MLLGFSSILLNDNLSSNIPIAVSFKNTVGPLSVNISSKTSYKNKFEQHGTEIKKSTDVQLLSRW